MPMLDQTERGQYIRSHIGETKSLIYVILRDYYGRSDGTVKEFDRIIEKAGIGVLGGPRDNIERKVAIFLDKCEVEFENSTIYAAFQLFSDDCKNRFITILFWYIKNMLYENSPDTDWERFLKTGHAIIKFSKFLKVKTINKALGLLNKRKNHSESCLKAPPCQLHNHIMEAGKGIRCSDKEFYSVLFLIEKLGLIYERIKQLFGQRDIIAGLPMLGKEIRMLYNGIEEYILVDSSLSLEDTTQNIKDILNNTTVLPEINHKVDVVINGLQSICPKCILGSLPSDDKDSVFGTINIVYDNIPELIAKISENLQFDLELSVLALDEEIAPIEAKSQQPRFPIRERLVPKDTLKYIKVSDA